jgi:hypothetical protein
MKTKLLLVILSALCCASCSTAPKAPDPFDTLLLEAAREMFKDTQFPQP